MLLLSALLGCTGCGGASEPEPRLPSGDARSGWIKAAGRDLRVTGADIVAAFNSSYLSIRVSGVAGEGDDLRGYEHSWSAAAFLATDIEPGEYRLEIRPFDHSIGAAGVSSSELPSTYVESGELWLKIQDGEMSGRAVNAEGGDEGSFSAPLWILCIAPYEQISEGYDPDLKSPFCRPLRRFL